MRRGILEFAALADAQSALNSVLKAKRRRHYHGIDPVARAAALFNTRNDAERAIKRAKRWLKNQSRGKWDVPPRHIFVNAELAARQFEDIATA